MCFGGGGGGGNTSKQTTTNTAVVTTTSNIANVNDPRLAEYVSQIESGQTARRIVDANVQMAEVEAIGHGLGIVAEAAPLFVFAGSELAGRFANTGRDVAYMGGNVGVSLAGTGRDVGVALADTGAFVGAKAIDTSAGFGGALLSVTDRFGSRALDTVDRAAAVTGGTVGVIPELVKLGTEAISKTAAVAEAGYAARGGNEISTVTDTTWNVNTKPLGEIKVL